MTKIKDTKSQTTQSRETIPSSKLPLRRNLKKTRLNAQKESLTFIAKIMQLLIPQKHHKISSMFSNWSHGYVPFTFRASLTCSAKTTKITGILLDNNYKDHWNSVGYQLQRSQGSCWIPTTKITGILLDTNYKDHRDPVGYQL